jgi:cytochrome c oxidase subunit 2
VHAPPLEGLFGRSVSLASGGTTFADETYLRDSILLPSRDITAGYPAVMPSFQGRVSEDQILALIAYIESLRDVREVPR